MAKQFSMTITFNHENGDEHDEYLTGTWKEVAERIRKALRTKHCSWVIAIAAGSINPNTGGGSEQEG